MDHFCYKNSALHAEDVSIEALAEEVGTPFYCYSDATLSRHYNVFADAFSSVKAKICFAVKANSNLAVLKTLADLGGGADAVSQGEIMRARKAGVPADKIIFSGVGKTKEEMAYALKEHIFQFNVESEPELEALNEVALSMGRLAPIAIRINPDVDAKTHAKISTGKKENKFGVDWTYARTIYGKAKAMKGIDVRGISTHIGSQLVDLMPFEHAFRRIKELVEILRIDGHTIRVLDLGGGLGIPYDENESPQPEHYAEVAIAETRGLGCELVFEPGRLIAGNAGILVTKVIYVKNTEHRRFVIVDAAMNDLMRPSLYDAYHDIVAVKEPSVEKKNWQRADVVGPVCESGDIFAKFRAMPPVAEGDLLAIRTAGAYGAVMSGTYNTRLLVPEVMVKGNQSAVIRPRQTYDELLGQDHFPEWMK